MFSEFLDIIAHARFFLSIYNVAECSFLGLDIWDHSGISCWGFRLPHARTGGVLIVAHRRLSTLRHNILRGSAKPPTSTGEVHFIRDREMI
jgi:hypothetical protein